MPRGAGRDRARPAFGRRRRDARIGEHIADAVAIEPPLPGIARAATFPIGANGAQWICLAEPAPHDGEDASDVAIPALYLQKYGPGPFAFTLSTAAGAEPAPPGAGTPVDPARLGNARCFLA